MVFSRKLQFFVCLLVFVFFLSVTKNFLLLSGFVRSGFVCLSCCSSISNELRVTVINVDNNNIKNVVQR